jgi:hypothetical protein
MTLEAADIRASRVFGGVETGTGTPPSGRAGERGDPAPDGRSGDAPLFGARGLFRDQG